MISEARLRHLSELLMKTAIKGASGLYYYPDLLIGEGGQGWVYRAGYDEPEGPWVVAKVLRPDVVNEDALSRFLREADVLRKLGQTQAPSPNVVRYFDHGIHRHTMPDGEIYALPFTVLEYVNGQTLGKTLEQMPGKGLVATRVRRLFRQIARALSLIHAVGLVHRDLKPSNLLILTEATQELVKITDFGLVKRFDEVAKGTLALAGASVGYAPPEQFEMGNRRVSPRTDLFAFATVLFEALTGQQAFSGSKHDTPFQILSRVLSGPRPQLAAHLATVSSELVEHPDIIAAIDRELDRATRSNMNERHESVMDFWMIVESHLHTLTNRIARGATKAPAADDALSSPQPPADLAASIPEITVPRSGPELSGNSISYISNSDAPSSAHRVLSEQGSAPDPTAQEGERAVRSLVFQPRSRSLLPSQARAMSFDPEGHRAFALGHFGLLSSDGTSWSGNLLPASLDPTQLQGLLAISQGVLVFGTQGQLWGQSVDGSFLPWATPSPNLTWRNAVFLSDPAEILLIGTQAPTATSILGILRPGQPLVLYPVDGVPHLTHGTRLTSGGLLLSGEDGTLIRLENGHPTPISWGRTGYLSALLPTPEGGAYVVGSGGHALSISALYEAKLEPVQTTRDLLTLTMTPTGPWAGGQDARLLQRTSHGWVRIQLPSSIHGAIRALQAHASSLSFLLDDGQWWEGKIA